MANKMTIQGTILKWGNSYGIRINKEVVEKMNLREKESIDFNIRKKGNPFEEAFGLIAEKPISKKRVRELSKELEGEWM